LRLAVAAGGGIGTWVWDVPGDRFYADERTSRLFLLDPARALEGVPLEEPLQTIHSDDLPVIKAAIARCLESGGNYEQEHRVVRGDGSIRWVSARGRCELDARGQPIRFPGVVLDITERKRIEDELHRLNVDLERRVAEAVGERVKAEAALRQAQKMEAVGQLTGGIAHDFNNLLTVISGNLDLVERGAVDERTRRLTAAAQRASERAAGLTAQLLAFSRRQMLRPEVLNASDLVREFEGLLRRAVGETIDVDLLADMPLWPCHVDAAQLESALLNLTLNARDAMSDGGTLRIEIRNIQVDETAAAAADLAPGPYVAVAVADTGCGMTAETLERVFEPFFTTKEAGKGTGLGLSMVYGFAKQSGGHVSISTELRRGTTVTLYLPKAEEMPKADASTFAEIEAEPVSGTMLVVEDEAEVLEVALATLADLGYTVLAARSGVEALEVLRTERRIDVLFSDVVMPHGMSGVALAREATRLRPEIKVLLTSGHAGDMLARLDAVDRFPVLGKPYRRSDLAERLQEVLGQTGGRHAPGRASRRASAHGRASTRASQRQAVYNDNGGLGS
jgi:signal transduction histidine kinase/CheY-like chemotaxis protein